MLASEHCFVSFVFLGRVVGFRKLRMSHFAVFYKILLRFIADQFVFQNFAVVLYFDRLGSKLLEFFTYNFTLKFRESQLLPNPIQRLEFRKI